MDQQSKPPHPPRAPHPFYTAAPQPVVTNADLSARIDVLEEKIDLLYARLNQSLGAWTVIKIIGSFLLGITVVASAIYNFFHH